MTYADAIGMTMADAIWFMERLTENREAEATAIANANAGAG